MQMKIADLNWMQVEELVARDDRAVVPLGSTEQHGYLSLATDSVLAERVALEAAEPLEIPVFPVLSYGIAPYFAAYPGSVSLRVETYAGIIRDLLDSLAGAGFRRITLVNGHGGNIPAQSVAGEWMASHPEHAVKLHSWWNAPRTWAKVLEIDPEASHASWMENFPWTRLAGVKVPQRAKLRIDASVTRLLDPVRLRGAVGDGSYGGRYERTDEEMRAIWEAGVLETRDALEGPWPPRT